MSYDFPKVTAADIEETWKRYGNGMPLKQGFAEWLAAWMNQEDEPPLPELIIGSALAHFPECCSPPGCWLDFQLL